jgi:hypothetical protein
MESMFKLLNIIFSGEKEITGRAQAVLVLQYDMRSVL